MTTLADRQRAFRVQLLRETLERHHGSRSAAARELGLARTYLQRLIRAYGVTAAAPAAGASSRSS